jgi:two-component system phosphate regulon sensor histidine kinase PhoR
MKIRWRLPLVFAVTTLVFAGMVALVSGLGLRGVFLDRMEDEMSRQARQYAATLEMSQAASAEPMSAEALQTLTQSVGDATETRFTVVDKDGKVLADSEADPRLLENHASRPEVAQALNGQEGRARRYSATLQQQEVYVAVPLPESGALWSQGVVRIAQPASRVDATVAASWRVPLIVWAVLLVPILGLAYLLTRTLTRPVERLRAMTSRVAAGDLTARNSVHRTDEMGELADSLNTMATQLQVRDVQLRAETEQSEQMLTAMNEGVLLTDADGHLLRSNPAAEKILGVDLATAVGQPLVVAARALPSQALAIKARDAGLPINEVLDLPDGRAIAVDVVPLAPAPTHAGGPQTGPKTGVKTGGPSLFVIRDETARRITDQVRRDFATNVSHELKTPLAGLSLLSQTLGNALDEDPAKAKEFAGRMSGEIQRLVDLANDLLTLSHLEEAGSQEEAVTARVDLSRLAREVADEVKPLAQAKQHALAVETDEPVFVQGNETSLRTLVRNLLENAIRYTEDHGHVSCQVQAEKDAEGKDWATLKVSDDGIGIPLADQSRIFERFYRVDKARSRETGGTGLGLSIVKHVADRHGGSVEVHSTVGVGSTFTVRLPAA